MTKIYIAGPMTGFVNRNHDNFEFAEKKFRDLGFEVVSPREIGDALCGNDPKVSNKVFLKEDLKHLLECDAIALLPFWTDSVGAKCEAAVALTMGMKFYDAHSGVEIMTPTDITIFSGYLE